jgi:hypothetical protein
LSQGGFLDFSHLEVVAYCVGNASPSGRWHGRKMASFWNHRSNLVEYLPLKGAIRHYLLVAGADETSAIFWRRLPCSVEQIE